MSSANFNKFKEILSKLLEFINLILILIFSFFVNTGPGIVLRASDVLRTYPIFTDDVLSFTGDIRFLPTSIALAQRLTNPIKALFLNKLQNTP